jgi:hypothetical protein
LAEEHIQSPTTFLNYLERKIKEVREREMKSHFDFENTQTILSLDRIFKATFANPDRIKFVENKT